MMRPRIIGEYFENSAMSHKLMFSAKDFMYTESKIDPHLTSLKGRRTFSLSLRAGEARRGPDPPTKSYCGVKAKNKTQ